MRAAKVVVKVTVEVVLVESNTIIGSFITVKQWMGYTLVDVVDVFVKLTVTVDVVTIVVGAATVWHCVADVGNEKKNTSK
ncbi:18638_t:CDS:2 [Funneliformis geosporum]|uniref:18638_t:CDS:1 n=1 Tax=Funneliformis geosporum TaxID=1117311 RepID=A0A9W4SJM2_9GLOM|nr:18638_t:CDS:2 [Funneliformis geosporum]